jgi:hypothetical protein
MSRFFPPHPSLPNFLAHYPTPKHTKTRKSSTFFLEFPQPNSWNLLNFFPGMNNKIPTSSYVAPSLFLCRPEPLYIVAPSLFILSPRTK